jgi:2-keto-4-pentenoate hydratase
MRTSIEDMGRRLVAADLDRHPIDVSKWSTTERSVAYLVQDTYVRLRCASTGEREVGFKISMTSPETQTLAGASGPAYGTFTSGMVLRSPAHIDLSAMSEPMLEPEIQFIVRRDIDPLAGVDEILRCCDVAAGLEVPDSRFARWFSRLSFDQIVCDNAVAGYVVIGTPVPADSLDLGSIEVQLHRNGVTVATGISSTVMGHPGAAVSWLVGELDLRGRRLEGGMVVSSGTLAMPVPLEPGDYRAAYGGLGEARLTIAR